MLDNFIGYISYVRCFSDLTVERYKLTLNKFNSFLFTCGKNLNDPQNITILDIYDYLGVIKKKGLLTSSSNAILFCIKSYFKYLDTVLELDVLNYRTLKGSKIQAPNIGFFDEQDKQKILNAVNEGFGTKKITQMRNRLITYMFLHTGLRVHELAKIRIDEIGESLQIIGKGGKRRFVYLREELLEMIREYVSMRKEKSEYLFPAQHEGHMAVGTIKNIYKKMSKKLGIHIHPHKFRHTFAVDLLHIPGSNIYNVSKLMGHTRITTTQIYLGVDNSELKQLQFGLKF